MKAVNPSQALETFRTAADAVADVLAINTDWGASGLRDGQYAVDLDADRACLEVLYRSGYRVLSEESGVTAPPGAADDAPIVVVDPLDGSTNASHGIRWFATALCLVDGEGPAVAMVANHASGDVYTASRGGGAFHNGRPCRPNRTTELSAAIVGVSGLPTHHYGWAQFRAMGASAPDICNVAGGATDAFVDMSDQHGVWDYLASILIAEEAGCVAGEIHGRELCVLDHTARRGPVVATTPALLDAILAERCR